MTFSQRILLWYGQNKRCLPWRDTNDPYKIWLSEIILQQTRVAQGMPYYLAFVKNFPTVHDLANAPEEKVLKLWQGLGYYSRARNLHTTAKIVVGSYGGQFPNTYNELLKLKGVGDYTASAIASICFEKPEPVVDGNVYRVLSRYYGIDLPINSTKGVKYFKALARSVMDENEIRDYNQAIMEFGAIQCIPKSPDCSICPLNDSCIALQTKCVEKLPVKKNKTKVRKRYFNYVVPLTPSNGTLIKQRKGNGIWRNLWEFPLIESEKIIEGDELTQNSELFSELLNAKIEKHNDQPIVHKLSHQHLYTTFWIARTDRDIEGAISFDELERFAVPVLIAEFLETFKNSYF
ncbi:A/G-specific adenine glycosylase [Pareuzebyella sediminis]|uniref:A/G-specific adenine glycosylase n=1 Tax=Pareuzebyella sediminis TaxID=2607998 RepID=UPI0011ED6062|nr:A/G-specific adenine glycosylase [Pareuzebyella sediminis]